MSAERLYGALNIVGESKWHLDNAGFLVQVYVRDGEVRQTDPRLDLWNTPKLNRNNMYRIDINIITAEMTKRSPRLSADELRSGGIDLRIFDLI